MCLTQLIISIKLGLSLKKKRRFDDEMYQNSSQFPTNYKSIPKIPFNRSTKRATYFLFSVPMNYVLFH